MFQQLVHFGNFHPIWPLCCMLCPFKIVWRLRWEWELPLSDNGTTLFGSVLCIWATLLFLRAARQQTTLYLDEHLPTMSSFLSPLLLQPLPWVIGATSLSTTCPSILGLYTTPPSGRTGRLAHAHVSLGINCFNGDRKLWQSDDFRSGAPPGVLSLSERQMVRMGLGEGGWWTEQPLDPVELLYSAHEQLNR